MKLFEKIQKHKLITAVIVVCALIILSIPFIPREIIRTNREAIDALLMILLIVVVNIYFPTVLFGVFVVLSIVKCNRLKSENGDVRLVARFVKRHKIISSFLVVLSLILVICMALSPFVAIGLPPFGIPEPTGTIVFDKCQMNRVDRIEMWHDGEVRLLNEQQIAAFVSATMVASRVSRSSSALYVNEVNNIRLYRGDVLVREMANGKRYIRVYMPSNTHWFFLSRLREPRDRSSANGGFVRDPRVHFHIPD